MNAVKARHPGRVLNQLSSVSELLIGSSGFPIVYCVGLHTRSQRPFSLDGRYQLVLQCKGLNNLTTSMARVRFLVYPYEAERCQYLDITLHGGTVPFENDR